MSEQSLERLLKPVAFRPDNSAPPKRHLRETIIRDYMLARVPDNLVRVRFRVHGDWELKVVAARRLGTMESSRDGFVPMESRSAELTDVLRKEMPLEAGLAAIETVYWHWLHGSLGRGVFECVSARYPHKVVAIYYHDPGGGELIGSWWIREMVPYEREALRKSRP